MNSLVLAGLPHAGKTSYLAILFAAMIDGRRVQIRLDNYRDDREYANTLAQRLVNCERAEHTPMGHDDGLSLSIVVGEVSTRLVAPDVSGEIWHQLLRERTWPSDFEKQVSNADGLCIFINAGDFHDDPPIEAVNAVGRGAVTEPRPEDSFSTQVDLIDFVQILGEKGSYNPGKRRVSVVLSAFDLAGDYTPAEWLAMNAPLFDQYVSSNESWLELGVFGVSAQGGSFEDESMRAKLLEADTIERAFVKSGDGALVNFDAPILWALDVD